MKRINIYIAIALLLTGIGSCDKNFQSVNVNPQLASNLDPVYLFSNAQFNAAIPTYFYQGAIVQQYYEPFTGVTEGGNHNVVYDANSSVAFNYLFKGPTAGVVSGPVALLSDVINQTKASATRTNLYNMARILKAYVFMVLVDSYGDVPYSEAGQGYLKNNYQPKYDDQAAIYTDILNELDQATAALDATKTIETSDLFYKGNIAQWKRLGYSLLLRAAMRYTKLDQAKAQTYVTKAVAGGLMQSNADNAYIAFNSAFTNPTGSWIQSTEKANIYMGKPLIDFLKSTNDPRLPDIAVIYAMPSAAVGATGNTEDNTPADQIGMPFGYTDATISTAPGFPGTATGGGWKYSQFNRRIVGKVDAPEFFVTYAQTELLLAEAAQRGWTPGIPDSLYNAGVRAHMGQMAQYDATGTIPVAAQNTYLTANPYSAATGLQQINTQYWIASFLNGSEAWANFRRSGFPALTPNPYPGADASVKGGFIYRLVYPFNEQSVNSANYAAAVSHIGGDNLGVHVFWDK